MNSDGAYQSNDFTYQSKVNTLSFYVLDNAEKNVSLLPLNASEVITPVHTIIKRACALSV